MVHPFTSGSTPDVLRHGPKMQKAVHLASKTVLEYVKVGPGQALAWCQLAVNNLMVGRVRYQMQYAE
jgi:hypothetical protein